jgi:hypothetical protein
MLTGSLLFDRFNFEFTDLTSGHAEQRSRVDDGKTRLRDIQNIQVYASESLYPNPDNSQQSVLAAGGCRAVQAIFKP